MHRMSLREVQEVARLAADTGASVHGGGPTVLKVADALGLPPSDVELLLDQARQGRSPIRDFKIVAGVAALIVAFLLGFGTTSLIGKHTDPGSVATATPASRGSVLAPTSQAVAAGSAVQTTQTGLPTASNESPSQFYAEGAPLESKTVGGDMRNGVDLARRLSAPVVDNGGPRKMMSASMSATAQ